MTDPRTGTSVIGIDPAIRRTGVARWRDGRLSTMTVVTNDTQPIEQRMRWICGNVWPLITTETFVVLEAPFMSHNGQTSMMLAGLHYVLRYGLHARGVPFGVVRPTELKQFACGTGNADKPAMVQMAAATYGAGANLPMGAWKPTWPLSDVDAVSHEADALWCLAMGLYHLYLSDWSPTAEHLAHTMSPGIAIEQQDVYNKVAMDWPKLEWS